METICYALVASLSFLGFVSIIYYVLLIAFSAKGKSKYIVTIPEKADESEINSLLYSAHLKSVLFGDLIFDSVTVITLSDNSVVYELAAEYGNMTVRTACQTYSDLRKEEDEDGAC